MRPQNENGKEGTTAVPREYVHQWIRDGAAKIRPGCLGFRGFN